MRLDNPDCKRMNTPDMRVTTRNAIVHVVGESIWGLQAAMVSSATVLAVLLKTAGAGDAMIGSIASIELVATTVPQIFGVWLFTSRRRLKRNLILWHVRFMSPWLFLMGGAVLARGAMPAPLFYIASH